MPLNVIPLGKAQGDNINQMMKITGWEFTKLLMQILNIFLNFGP